MAYVDDVVVFSPTFDKHLADVRQVLQTLKRGGLSLKQKKCVWFSPSVDYLGHVILPGKLAVAQKNTYSIEKSKWPENQTELRSFLGTVSYTHLTLPTTSRV